MNVAIVGGAGRMGKLLVNYFSSYKSNIIVSDPLAPSIKHLEKELGIRVVNDNTTAVSNADVAIISVPMESTGAVIREVIPRMKKEAVLCEISSIKAGIPATLRSLKQHGVRLLSVHPLFGEGAEILKKRMALIPLINKNKELDTARRLFPDFEIIVVDSEEHDRIMALTISLPYFVNLIIASVLRNENITTLQKLGGTTFRMQLMLTGGVMFNACALHEGLHKRNSHAFEILKKFHDHTASGLRDLNGEGEGFGEFCRGIKAEFGRTVDLTQSYSDMYRVLCMLEDQITSEVVP